MMWFKFMLNGAVLIAYCIANAALLSGIWRMLNVGIPAERHFRDIFFKTALSVVIVFCLALLIGRMFCWTAMITHCLACICPVTAGISIEHVSPGGALLFLVSIIFTQLVLIPIPVRLSRLLFVLTVIASNVVAGLLKLGLSALFM